VALFAQYKGLWGTLKRYLYHYGGLRAVVTSPLFLLSIVVAALDYDTVIHRGWVVRAEAMIPSLLGFSLGTYAILFSILSGPIRQALQRLEASPGVSYLQMINATFFHFIFVQILALLWAFLYGGTALTDLANAYGPSMPAIATVVGAVSFAGSYAGYFLLVYSFLLVFGSALAVYRLAGIKEPPPKHTTVSAQPTQPTSPPADSDKVGPPAQSDTANVPPAKPRRPARAKTSRTP
jgi:hypothetical protein